MKARTIVIAAVSVAAVGVGGYFGIRQLAGSTRKPVSVVPVSTVNASYYSDEEGQTISGNIISKDTQSVDLDTEYPLAKVYVETGDRVKIGDPLMEYDMTMPVLQQEMHDLDRQRLELSLQVQQKALEKLMRNPGAATVSAMLDAAAGEDEKTNSADIDLEGVIELTDDGGVTAAQDTAGDVAALYMADDGLVEDLGGSSVVSPTDTTSGGSGDTTADTSSDPTGGSPGNEELIDPGTGAGDEIIGDDMSDDSGDDMLIDDLLVDEDPVDDLIISGDDSGIGDDSGLLVDPSAEEGQTGETDPQITDEQETDETQQAMERLLRELIYNRLEQLSYYAGAVDRYEYRENDISGLKPANIDTVLSLFENYLTDPGSEGTQTLVTISPDAFANTRQETIYRLKQDVLDYIRELPDLEVIEPADSSKAPKINELRDIDANSVYIMYAKVKFADLVYKMGQLEQKLSALSVTADSADSATAKSLEDTIKKAADAYYSFIENWNDITNRLTVNGIDPSTIRFSEGYFTDYVANLLVSCAGVGDPNAVRDGSIPVSVLRAALSDDSSGSLSMLIAKLNDSEVVEETEAPPETEAPLEPETEYDDGFNDFDDEGLGDEENDGYTRAELEELLRTQKAGIKETELQLRENAIKLKQDDRILEKRIVYATMDGVVTSAGTLEEGGAEDGFIEISGSGGMYVEGTVNELSRDSLKIGDVISGMSWENYASFTAKVTEISVYPTTNQDSMYGNYGENSNASYYPFLAYIEESEGIVEGMAEMRFVRPESTGGLYLDQYMVRTDNNGRSYVCIDNGSGRLKKQIVKTGKRVYGTIEIKGGLSMDDLIAFPYGKNVTEGAQTVVANELDGMSYSMY